MYQASNGFILGGLLHFKFLYLKIIGTVQVKYIPSVFICLLPGYLLTKCPLFFKYRAQQARYPHLFQGINKSPLKQVRGALFQLLGFFYLKRLPGPPSWAAGSLFGPDACSTFANRPPVP